MTEHAWCPRCRHENPSENRFCGSCGASLGASSDLVACRVNNPTVMGHALPVKPGPIGKASRWGWLRSPRRLRCPGCATGPQQKTGHRR
jgi:Double zinc ribbon